MGNDISFRRSAPLGAAAKRVGSRRHGGFSLIEMAIVMVIVALVGAMALPRYGNAVAHYRLDAAAKRVAADIAMARAQAVTTSNSQTITFTTSTKTYTMSNVTALDNRSTTYSVNLGAEPYKVSLQSVVFGAGTTVTFNAYGAPDNGGSVVVSLGTATKTISVEATTGRTTIQ
jgi:prepilin-type N-terminal cleavage/methylation domain-containing protein